MDKLIYVTPQASTPSQSGFGKNIKKIIFGSLILVAIIEVIFGYKTLTAGPKVQKVWPLSDAAVVLDSPSLNYQVGDTVTLNIRVSTGGRMTDSADLIIRYDPSVLESLGNSAKTSLLYADYPINEVQNGTIKISGTTPKNTEGFVGVGNLAEVTFKAKVQGKTKISVDFTKGSTTDSNVIESGTNVDVLSSAYDLEVGIGQAKISRDQVSCKSYTQSCRNIAGQVGLQTCVAGSDKQGCGFDPYSTVSCGLCEVTFPRDK